MEARACRIRSAPCSCEDPTPRSRWRIRSDGATRGSRTWPRPRESTTRSRTCSDKVASTCATRRIHSRDALRPVGVEAEPVPLPDFRGPEACLHLMSLISVLGDDLAVVYSRLLPTPFRKFLRERGFDFVEVPDAEFETMAPNVLAV